MSPNGPQPTRSPKARVTTKRSVSLALLLMTLTCTPLAAESPDLAKLIVYPETIMLSGPRARQQLVITGVTAAGELVDVSAVARVAPSAGSPDSGNSPPAIVSCDRGILRPLADGSTTLTITAGGQSADVTVTVRDHATPTPISFDLETQPALTKAGCNMGACHGSPTGKGGFRLSLRAYDRALDVMTLRTEFFGRRINPEVPEKSLLLRKPLMEVYHGGGQRLLRSDPEYRVLLQWITDGTPVTPGPRQLIRLHLYPPARVLQAPVTTQQLVAIGEFSDGSHQDLTELTDFTSSAETVAKVDRNGRVSKQARGEATILARFLDQMATTSLTFLEPVPGFAWTNPPQFNVIDTLVDDKLRTMQIPPAPLCSDHEYQRRLTLDLIGRLPRPAEVRAFLADESAVKREQLADQLLRSDEFARYWALKFCDNLRVNTKRFTAEGADKFHRWLTQQLSLDRPVTEWSRELLTASGSTLENPPALFWKASREPLDATETTTQLFLGVRLQCAKCHNHPFERWTQDNYYGVAAAFARIGRKPTSRPQDEFIFASEAGEALQPRTGRVMPVYLPLAGEVTPPAGSDRRETFADWLVEPDNPFFARAIVNRVWGHLFGRGLVEPVDDFRDSNPASNPAVLARLTHDFRDSGFRLSRLIRQIVTSRTYQQSAETSPLNEHDELYSSHRLVKLLSAEQLLDAVSSVTGIAETFPGQPAGLRATELAEPPVDNAFLKAFGQPARDLVCQCERSSETNLSQTLQMMNGSTVISKLRHPQGRIARAIAAGRSDDELIAELYLAAVSRLPTAAEQQTAHEHIARTGDRQAAFEDLSWAILNTKEFLFQH